MASSSQAMTKRSAESALMPPPPPPKRMKRPPTILDEDTYTDALSSIIARDFFPGLLEARTQQEYLDALDSQDSEWIAHAGRQLTEVMTPGRRRRGRRGVSLGATPRAGSRAAAAAEDTPRGSYYGGDTPMSVASDISASTSATQQQDKGPEVDTTLSLDGFLSKYTSEDNASFSSLLERQNRKRAEKYAWLRNGDNKILAPRQILHRAREQKLLESSKPVRNAIEPADSRPAVSSTRSSNNQSNSLMFVPDAHYGQDPSNDEASRAPPKAISHSNTRLLAPQGLSTDMDSKDEPPTPTISAVDAAISGRPRRSSSNHDTSSISSIPSTPRVNGYAFISDSPSPPSSPPRTSNLDSNHPLLPSADSTPNPFKLQSQPAREKLHHRIVDRAAKNNRSSSSSSRRGPFGTPSQSSPSSAATTPRLTPYQRHSLLGAKTPLSAARLASDGTPIPRFGFDGRTPRAVNPESRISGGRGSKTAGGDGLTPAAQRLWSRVEAGRTPRAKSAFGESPGSATSKPKTNQKTRS
ncbi:MAG: hypothetical protein M1837_006329 [Sclerophora amabilis]|nr:MAG: hypothetical protein M1837_006329 [Sclerophora amabilis]